MEASTSGSSVMGKAHGLGLHPGRADASADDDLVERGIVAQVCRNYEACLLEHRLGAWRRDCFIDGHAANRIILQPYSSTPSMTLGALIMA